MPERDILYDALFAGDFFMVRDIFDAKGSRLARRDNLACRAYIANALNRPRESSEYIAEMIFSGQDRATRRLRAAMLQLRADNCVKMYRYGEAAHIYGQLSADTGLRIPFREREQIENISSLWRSLSDVPPMGCSIKDGTTVKSGNGGGGFLRVPVAFDKVRARSGFVLDTGANLSTITYSGAVRYGLLFMGGGVDIYNSTGSTVRPRVAVAPLMKVGRARFTNVVFLVLSDEQLSFSSMGFSMEGIIGLPVISAVGRLELEYGSVRLSRRGAVPRGVEANMFMDSMCPVVSVRHGGIRSSMLLDTGAVATQVSKGLYDHNKTALGPQTAVRKIFLGGAGGVVNRKVKLIRNFELAMGDDHRVLHNVTVNPSDNEFFKRRDGIVGLDFLMARGRLVIDFRHMAVWREHGSVDNETFEDEIPLRAGMN